jgi:RNA polymerase sigma-70 factor (ECF subfamily)
MKQRPRRVRAENSVLELLPRFDTHGHTLRPHEEWGEAVEAAFQRPGTLEVIRNLIDRLPAPYRVVLILRDVEEIDTEETARLLGVSPHAVKVRLHRARQALRALLDAHFRRSLS